MKRALRLLLAAGVAAVLTLAGYGPALQAQQQPKKKDGADRRVVIVNGRSTDLMRLYASRTTTSDWEENVLTQPIRAGSRIVVNFDDGTGSCRFDFRAVFRDSQQAHSWNFDVCAESYWHLAD